MSKYPLLENKIPCLWPAANALTELTNEPVLPESINRKINSDLTEYEST